MALPARQARRKTDSAPAAFFTPLINNLRQAGFTLIEVLIALAVIAIGLVAVIAVAGKSEQTQAGLEARTFAHWIAENRAMMIRVAPSWPSIGSSHGTTQFADQQWDWTIQTTSTADKDLRRVTIRVAQAAHPKDYLVTMQAFVGHHGAFPMPNLRGQASGENAPPPSTGQGNGL